MSLTSYLNILCHWSQKFSFRFYLRITYFKKIIVCNWIFIIRAAVTQFTLFEGPWEYHKESIMFKTTFKRNKFGVLLYLRIHKAPVGKKVCDELQYSSMAQQGTSPEQRAEWQDSRQPRKYRVQSETHMQSLADKCWCLPHTT